MPMASLPLPIRILARFPGFVNALRCHSNPMHHHPERWKTKYQSLSYKMAAQPPPTFLISFKETLIKWLSDFTLKFLYMTKSCIKILVESDSAIESAFP